MSKRKETWNTKDNAEAYDAYAGTFPMYKDTSRDLVEVTGIQPGMTIVDLAAGTGVTTQVILDKTVGNVRIILIDQAEEMLKKARKKLAANKNIEFIVAKAEDLDKVIREPVDAVICNSAFWQMKPKEVFKAVSHVLHTNGLFAFNLPNQFFDYQGFKGKPKKPLSYRFGDLVCWGKETGLAFISQSVKEYDKSIEEIIAFNRIPVMQKNFVSEKERVAFISELKSNKNGPKRTEWAHFVFKKIEETTIKQ